MRPIHILCFALLSCFAIAACSESSTTPPDTIITNGKIRYFAKDTAGSVWNTFVTDQTGTTPTLFLANSIVFSQPRNGQMLVLRANGGGNPTGASIVRYDGTLVRDVTLPGNMQPPFALSPNGNVLLYAASDKYYLKNIATGVDVLLTASAGREGTVAFSRDGSRVAFYEDDSIFGRDDRLVVANSDGTGRVVVTDTAWSVNDLQGGLAWNAAGDRLYFTRSDNYRPMIWSIGVDGSTPTLITGQMVSATMPTLSPDGKTLAIIGASVASQASDIWLVAPDGTNLRKLTTMGFQHVASYPNWSPDGKKVIYVDADHSGSGDPQGGYLHIVDVSTGVSTQLDTRPNVYMGFWDY